MTKAFPRLSALAPLAVLLVLTFAINTRAQAPAASSLRNTPNEIDKNAPVVEQIISNSERFFHEGELHLKANQRYEAREKFDKAVDTILNAGLDVRGNPRLQTYYLELTERIYRLEVPQQRNNTPAAINNMQQVASNDVSPASMTVAQQQEEQEVGFKDQKFEPSPLDDLAKLVLTTSETTVDPADMEGLEMAKNSLDFQFNPNPLIQQYINYYQGRGRGTMESGLRRSGQFMKMARQIFREEGVPEDIVWLGQVESAWRTKAYSSAAASGLWQFIPGTGRAYGLRQTAWIDERNSLEKATRASARYLKFLARRYNGNWELAMGAYNTGEGNVDRAIQRAGRADFWAIYPYIAQETRNYVPNIMATILIAKNREKYGFGHVRPDAPLAYDIIEVQSATSLRLIAAAAGTSVDYIQSLNPELRKDVTPRGEAYRVRIPAGKSKDVVAYIKNIPVDRRDQAPGLTQMVSMTRERPNTAAPTSRGLMKVRARAGDTIAKIAERSNVSADEVARLNGMPVNAELQPGLEIKVPSATPNTRGRGR